MTIDASKTAENSILAQHTKASDPSLNMSPTSPLRTTPLTRSFSNQIPKWQQFQTSLVPSVTNVKPANNKRADQQTEPPHPYMRQYSHIYHQRLFLLKSQCWNTVQADGDNKIASTTASSKTSDNTSVLRVDRILDLRENTLCVVVGTLVKDLSASGDKVLKTLSECCESDQLYLEDESGRISIDLNTNCTVFGNSNFENSNSGSSNIVVSKHALCSGLVVGLMGNVGLDGSMLVDKIYYPTVPTTNIPKVLTATNDMNDDSMQLSINPNYILLLSGLHCGSVERSSLPRDMLLSFLYGIFPKAREKASQVSHVICAGGLLTRPATKTKPTVASTSMASIKNQINYEAETTIHGCRELDGFVYQLTSELGIPTTIIPGENDPTTANWPQRPIHQSLLPTANTNKAISQSLLSIVPNPYSALFKCNIRNGDGVSSESDPASLVHNNDDDDDIENDFVSNLVMGTDGRNIQDIVKHVLIKERITPTENNETPAANCNDEVMQVDDEAGTGTTNNDDDTYSYRPITEIEALECTVQWGHLCPTGPSITPTVPNDRDPMVLKQIPSIYFGGNCTKFTTKLLTNDTADHKRAMTRLICLPNFSETGEAVLVNIKTLQVELLRFEN